MEQAPEPGQTGQWEIRATPDTGTIEVRLESWTSDELKWSRFELTPEAAYRFFRDGLEKTLALDPTLEPELD
jgi:hypothetical protein